MAKIQKNYYLSLVPSMVALLLLSACATTPPPSWVDLGSDPQYPRPTFITATGCGKTVQGAEARARQGIAESMLTVVHSNTSVDSASAVLERQGKRVSTQTQSVRSRVRDTSDIELAAVSYPKLFHKGSHSVCVLGAENTDQARATFQTIGKRIKGLLAKLHADTNGLNRLQQFRNAVKITQLWRAQILALNSLGSLSGQVKTDTTVPLYVLQAYKTMKRLGTYRVQANSSYTIPPAAAQSLTQAVERLFTGSGMLEDPYNGAFIVQATLDSFQWINLVGGQVAYDYVGTLTLVDPHPQNGRSATLLSQPFQGRVEIPSNVMPGYYFQWFQAGLERNAVLPFIKRVLKVQYQ
ncbi:MAG: hypothetical protein ACYDBP_06675 [Leptospirales bacterium]